MSFFLQVVAHSSQMIYTRMIGDKEEDDKEAEGGVVVRLSYQFKRHICITLHVKQYVSQSVNDIFGRVSCSVIPI